MRVPRRIHSVVSALLTMSALAAAPTFAAPAPPKHSMARGFGGAIVSDNPEATRAGLLVLRKGGSAADAAVAAAAVLGVTDPYVGGVGGGGYFVF
jgi:gamma-glutamyltranspeptidase/glutathione hydrolase